LTKPYLLPAALPEEMGVKTGAILDYLKGIDACGVNLHGFLLARGGKIVAEGYWAPYKQDELHRLYSVSKSFASAAIGILCDEGVISLEDKIADHFPDKLPAKGLHPYQAEMTVRHLLTMSTCYAQTTYSRGGITYPDPTDWVRTFFECPPARKPGQTFKYDTSGSTVLGALVERKTGMDALSFLKSRGLSDAGFSDESTVIRTPNGEFAWMGSGVLASLRDLALFAQMVLNKGELGGRRIVSEDYMTKATSRQIDNTFCSDDDCGYGFQFWMSKTGFKCYGMGGQMVYFLPEHDAFLCTIAETQGQPHALDQMEKLLEGCLIPGFEKESLPENVQAQEDLAQKIAALHVMPLCGINAPETAARVSGRTYRMDKNPDPFGSLKFDTLKIDFTENGGALHLNDAAGEKILHFAYDGFAAQKTFSGFLAETESPRLIYGFTESANIALPCMTSGAWADEKTLNLLCYATGAYLGTLKMQIVFEDDSVTLTCQKAAERFWSEFSGMQSGVLCK